MSNDNTNTKSIFASKTFWLNAIQTAIAVTGVFIGAPWIVDHPQLASGLVVLSGILNVFLRYVTDAPVTLLGTRSQD